MKRLAILKEAWQAEWDKNTGKEIFAPGARVKVAHKGRIVVGKVVRYDKAGGPYRGSPFYVVDVGEYESKIVPAKDVEPLREEVDNKTRRFNGAQAYCDNRAWNDVSAMKMHIAEVYQITGTEAVVIIRKAYAENAK